MTTKVMRSVDDAQADFATLTAAEVPFTPAGSISATDVQGAIEEAAAEAGGGSVAAEDVTVDPAVLGQTDAQAALQVLEGVAVGAYNAVSTLVNGQDVDDVDFDIGIGWQPLLVEYQVLLNTLTATRTITLPDTNAQAVPTTCLFPIMDTTGNCSGSVKIRIVCAGTDTILNAAAGPSPATEYDLQTPYASVVLVSPNVGQWEIVAVGPGAGGYQPLDADLTAIAGLTSAANKGIQFTGSGTAGLFDLTAAGKALLDDTAASDQRTTLGLGTAAVAATGDFDAAGAGTAAAAAALAARTITAGTGLTGGGTLAADRTLAADFGSGAGKVTQGNDSRLSDSRTPTAHKTSHQSGGSDAIDVTGLTGVPTRATLGLDTTDSPQFAGLNVGAATDTTLDRASAGVLQVEGKRLFAVDGADVPVADGGTGASTAAGARTNLGLVIGTDVRAQGSGDPTNVPGYAATSSGILVPLLAGYVSMFSSLAAGTYSLVPAEGAANALASGGAGVIAVLDLVASELAVAGLTTKLNLQAFISASGTTPGAGWTATFGLYPITPGGTTNLAYTAGTVVSGSTAAPAWAVNTVAVAVSGDFTLPANGAYGIFVVTNQALAANMVVRCGAKVRVRNV